MKNLLVILIGALLYLSSCQEKGCNDPDAVNYEDSINKNDGSCKYESKIVFINSLGMQEIVDEGGEVFITMEGNQYPTIDHSALIEVVNCSVGAINVSHGGEKELEVNYTLTVTDAEGVSSVSGGQLVLSAGGCSVNEL